MTIIAGSTTREILQTLAYEKLNKFSPTEADTAIICTMGLVASLGNLEHRLEEITTYLASIEGQLFVRK